MACAADWLNPNEPDMKMYDIRAYNVVFMLLGTILREEENNFFAMKYSLYNRRIIHKSKKDFSKISLVYNSTMYDE